MTNKEAMFAAIKSRIGGDRNHGWGRDDSFAVVLAIISNETGVEIKDLEKPESVGMIRDLINPSQFRQMLEKNDILAKGEKIAKGNTGLKALMESLK